MLRRVLGTILYGVRMKRSKRMGSLDFRLHVGSLYVCSMYNTRQPLTIHVHARLVI